MKEVANLHNEAMRLAASAQADRYSKKIESAQDLFRAAFEKERRAASLVDPAMKMEPTRAVLHRSAASLALQCQDIQSAKELATQAMLGVPPRVIVEELREILATASGAVNTTGVPSVVKESNGPTWSATPSLTTNLNRGQKFLDKLIELMPDAENIDILASVFELPSLLLLAGQWQFADRVRIVVGRQRHPVVIPDGQHRKNDPNDSAIEMEKAKKDDISGLIAVKNALVSNQLQVRVHAKDDLHGAAYIVKTRAGTTKAFLGSAEFTENGLLHPLQLMASLSCDQCNEITHLFDDLFDTGQNLNESLTAVIDRHMRDFTPFEVYLKALQEFFRGRELTAGAWEEQESKLYRPLLSQYQQDGYRQLLRIAGHYNGALLCDGVGLGKTFVALMLIERMLYERKRVALVVPKSTHDAVWKASLSRYLPEAEGLFGKNVVIYNHTDLLRGASADRNFPAEFEEIRRHCDVIIVDEAHNFRSPSSQRAQRLFELAEGKQVFLLTATPVNNSLFDLEHLIEFFTRRDDARFAHLGINSVRGYLVQKEKIITRKVAEKSGVEDGQEYDMVEAEKILQDDRLFREVVVQRSRAYVMEREKSGAKNPVFPDRVPPTVADYELSPAYAALLGDLRLAFDRDDPLLKLAIYYPMAYAIRPSDSTKDKMEANQQKQVVGLVRTTMLKRFESSWKSFQYTCEDLLLRFAATVRRLDEKKYNKWSDDNALWMKQIEQHARERYELDESKTEEGKADVEEEDLLTHFEDGIPELDPRLYNIKKIVADSLSDMFLLVKFLGHIQGSTSKQDTKLQRLLGLLRNDPYLSKHKVIIFTEYRDTARYLGRSLAEAGIRHVEEIDSGRKLDRLEVIRRFAPLYNYDTEEKHQKALRNPIRVLISTDVLAEGLNLQDSFLLINYDLHWNPVRLMQRIGRVDRRLNPETESKIRAARPEENGVRGTVRFWNFLPPGSLNDILTLYQRVAHKVLRISETTGLEGEKLLTKDDDFHTFKNFNASYVGTPSIEERLRLTLSQALAKDKDLAEQLDGMPGRVFSAKSMGKNVSGLFACFRLPFAGGPDKTGQLGEARWFFLPDGATGVLTGLEEINAHIVADESTPRVKPNSTADRRKRLETIERHIRTHELKQRKATTMAQVAAGAMCENRLQLIAWMEVVPDGTEKKDVEVFEPIG